MKYRNVKLKVLSPEHSAAFQEAVFESGGGWYLGGKTVQHTDSDYITVDTDGVVTYCSEYVFFVHNEAKQIHFITPAYKMTKIRIRNSYHSAFVQKKLFENGCSWMGGFTEAQHTDKPCLTVSETGEIRFCTASFFDEQAHLEEIFIEDDSDPMGVFEFSNAPSRMSLCPKCGNKLCHKAKNSEYKCTGTNDKQSDPALETDSTTTSDGSTASYYELPSGATELQHLISHKNMNAQIGEIFRSCYRYGQASHSDKLRDAKKIQFYINAEIERLEKCKP